MAADDPATGQPPMTATGATVRARRGRRSRRAIGPAVDPAEYDPGMLRRRAPASSASPAGATVALLAALLALAILPLPVAAAPSRDAPRVAQVAPASTAIVPGSVNRSSLLIRAEYNVDARLTTATRSLRGRVTITARNMSGAGIDRLELNTVMGPLGALRLGAVTVDGHRSSPGSTTRRSWSRSGACFRRGPPR